MQTAKLLSKAGLKFTFQKDFISLQTRCSLQFCLYPMQTRANCKTLLNLPKQVTPSHRGADWWDISPKPVSASAKLGRAVGSSDIKPLSSCVVLSANGNGKEKKDLLSCLKSSYPPSQSQGSRVIGDVFSFHPCLRNSCFCISMQDGREPAVL